MSDVPIAARLLGERVILTEVFSYNHLAQSISSGQITESATVVILSYALCGSHTWQRWQSLSGARRHLLPHVATTSPAYRWKALTRIAQNRPSRVSPVTPPNTRTFRLVQSKQKGKGIENPAQDSHERKWFAHPQPRACGPEYFVDQGHDSQNCDE